MQIEYDPVKTARNIEQRGLSFELALAFDWASADVRPDTRRDYGEQRFVATGLIGDHLYQLVFTWRNEKARVISLRRANKRERKHHENQTRSRVA